MAVGKEIRNQISSIKSTQKITSAMEMVAASKMRKAQERMQATRPYAEKMRQVIAHCQGECSVQTPVHGRARGQTRGLYRGVN